MSETALELPPWPQIKEGLRSTTERLAMELGHPGGATPAWSELEWQLAAAAAAAHGVSALLAVYPRWYNARWARFLDEQHEHVAQRHRRITDLLARIDADARDAGIALVPLKGSALHALGLYNAGERPMADIDLLVDEGNADRAAALITRLGYAASFATWKHRVFRPVAGESPSSLGEHRDTPINIELHTGIQERLPVSTVDITTRIWPAQPQAGLHAYPSLGALMCHLLLHAAGNICTRSVRLIHLNDIALLAPRLARSDWHALWQHHSDELPWWALPPLRLVSRYFPHAVPASLLYELEIACPPLLRAASRRHTVTQLSCSALWLHALPGIEWSRTPREAGQYLLGRVRPSGDAVRERNDMVRTQRWLQDQPWVRSRQLSRLFAWLTRPVPRPDTLYVVRAALSRPAR